MIYQTYWDTHEIRIVRLLTMFEFLHKDYINLILENWILKDYNHIIIVVKFTLQRKHLDKSFDKKLSLPLSRFYNERKSLCPWATLTSQQLRVVSGQEKCV